MEPLLSLAGSRPTLAPLSPGRFALQVTLDQATYDQLRYAQSLLGHALPSGDVGAVLKRALDALVCKLEQQKFAKSARSSPRRSAAHGRYVPADVRRAVWQRDGGQCTFESESGKRCEARTRLEFDHIEAVARGRQATAAEPARERDVVPWLRALGFNAETARRGAANCAHIPDAPLEERVRLALQSLARNSVRRAAPGASITQ